MDLLEGPVILELLPKTMLIRLCWVIYIVSLVVGKENLEKLGFGVLKIKRMRISSFLGKTYKTDKTYVRCC